VRRARRAPPLGRAMAVLHPALVFVLLGALLGSAPGLRKFYALLWRPYIAVPVLLFWSTQFYDVVIRPMYFMRTWIAPSWGLEFSEYMMLAPAVSRFNPLQSASAAQTVFTAFELDVFQLARRHELSPSALAKAQNITEGGARVVLEVLAELGLLRKSLSGFSHEWSDAALDLTRRNAAFVRNVELPLVSHLTEAVRTGRAVGLHKAFGSKYKSLYHARTEVPELVAWTDMMNSVSAVAINTIMGRCDRLLSQAKRMLDFCGNEGQNAMTLARNYPGMQITVHDLPAVIENPERGTAARIRDAGLDKQISVFPWDLTTRPFEPPRSDYDLVMLMNCVNEWRREELDRNLRALLGALRPGGTLVIFGSFSSRSRVLATDIYSVWLAAPYFVAATQDGGQLYDYEELEEAASAAGYADVRTEVWEVACIIFMKKPGA